MRTMEAIVFFKSRFEMRPVACNFGIWGYLYTVGALVAITVFGVFSRQKSSLPRALQSHLRADVEFVK